MEQDRDKNRKLRSPYILAGSIFLVVLVLLTVHYTIAYLKVTDKKTNNFSVGTLDVKLTESFYPNEDGEMIKENVCVTNKGAVSSYVRAIVSVYWIDQNGTILSELPVPEFDYTITLNSEWLEKDGIYYYPESIGNQESTEPLIIRCEQMAEYNSDRVLVVDIASQAIQSSPSEAASTAWGVIVDENTNRIGFSD